MGINSNVKKSDELKTQEINELAVYLNSLDPADKEKRDFAFEKLWLAVKKFVISILKSRYPTYYTKHFEEMLDCAALDIFLELPKYDINKGAFTTYISRIVAHAGQKFVNEYSNTSAYYGAAIAKIKKAMNAMEKESVKFDVHTLSERTGLPITTINTCLEQIHFSETVHLDTIPADFLSDINGIDNSPEAKALAKEEAISIRKAIENALPEDAKRIVLFSYGFETGEPVPDARIAEILNINKATVRRKLNTAIRTLGASLKREQLFQNRIIRQEIDSQEINFIPKTAPDEIEDAKLFMQMNTSIF